MKKTWLILAHCFLVFSMTPPASADDPSQAILPSELEAPKQKVPSGRVPGPSGKLFVDVAPAGARIRILNIKPKFKQGMSLDSSMRYTVEVSMRGFSTTIKRGVKVEPGKENRLKIKLRAAPKNSPKADGPDAEAAKPEKPSHYPGEVWTEPNTSMAFVWVPGGCFQIGCGPWADDCEKDEYPAHQVCVEGFWLGRTEVTQGQWKAAMKNNPAFENRSDQYPVERVSWEDTQKFIAKLSEMDGGKNKFRLPTEAEWEYACRAGGKETNYPLKDVDEAAWYYRNSGGRTHMAGSLAPNGLGLYDMGGNVYEMVQDAYSSDAYLKHSRNNPLHAEGTNRVKRGGSWNYERPYLRCSHRNSVNPGTREKDLGFRLAKTP